MQNSNSGLEFSLYPQHLGDLAVLDGPAEVDDEDGEANDVTDDADDVTDDADDDVHICGTCKIQFTNIEAFVEHKKNHHRSMFGTHFKI